MASPAIYQPPTIAADQPVVSNWSGTDCGTASKQARAPSASSEPRSRLATARPAFSENLYFRFRNTCRGDTRKSRRRYSGAMLVKPETRRFLASSVPSAVPYSSVINNQNAQTSRLVPVTRNYDRDSWNLLLFLLLDADLYFEECELRFCNASKWRIAILITGKWECQRGDDALHRQRQQPLTEFSEITFVPSFIISSILVIYLITLK